MVVEARGARTADGSDLQASERILAELFGGQFTPPDPNVNGPAIFEQLVARYGRQLPAEGDYRTLAPSPLLDKCLKRLVAIIQGDYDGRAEGEWQARSATFELAMAQRLLLRIRTQPLLCERARWLRQFAGAAETAMEHAYSERLLARLRTHGRAVSLLPHGRQRTHALEQCLFEFPYLRSYLQLAAAELAVLRSGAAPVLLRDRELIRLAPSERREFRELRAKLHAACAHSAPARPLREQTIAVCGAGPLPISGFLLHTLTGARVMLIDRDPQAVSAARGWIDVLERLNVLEPGAVRVREADVMQLERLTCEIAVVASLIGQRAKLAFAERLSAAQGLAPQTLLVRSAGGTCAELAYEAVDTGAICRGGWPFWGESVPRSQVFTGLTPLRAASCGLSADASSEVLAIAPRHVLNSTELYRRVPQAGELLSALQPLILAAHRAPAASHDPT